MTTKPYDAQNHIFYTNQGTDVLIGTTKGQKLNIACNELTCNNVVLPNGLIAERLQTKGMSDNVGLNQLSNGQLLDQDTSGQFLSEGTSCAIMDSGTISRIACGGPKMNSGGSTFGGVLTYSSTNGSNFTGPVGYNSNTFCDDYTGAYVDINEDGSFFSMSLNIDTNIYKWNGSSYSYNTILLGFASVKLSGNYALCSNYYDDLSVYFYNGSAWVFQQKLSSDNIFLFDIQSNGAKAYIYSMGHFYEWSRSGTSWSLSVDTDLFIGGATIYGFSKSGNLVIFLRDNIAIDVWENNEYVLSFNESYIISCTTNGTYIFYNDGSEITVASKIAGSWTRSLNKTAFTNVDNMCCNADRLVCGRSAIDTYGCINVFHIDPYTNSLVNTNLVYGDASQNLVIDSIYRDVNVSGRSINLDFRDGGSMNINGSANVLGNLNVGTDLTIAKISMGDGSVTNPCVSFINDTNTGIYQSAGNNFDIAINGVNCLNLSSTSLNVPKVICPNFFKMNMYNETNVQNFNNAVGGAVLFSNNTLIENFGIVKSSISYPGASTGSRFTNSTGSTVRLMVCWAVSVEARTNLRADMSLLSNVSSQGLGRVSQNLSNQGFAMSSSCMLVLANTQYFDIVFTCVPASNLSINSGNASYLQIYVLG